MEPKPEQQTQEESEPTKKNTNNPRFNQIYGR